MRPRQCSTKSTRLACPATNSAFVQAPHPAHLTSAPGPKNTCMARLCSLRHTKHGPPYSTTSRIFNPDPSLLRLSGLALRWIVDHSMARLALDSGALLGGADLRFSPLRSAAGSEHENADDEHLPHGHTVALPPAQTTVLAPVMVIEHH